MPNLPTMLDFVLAVVAAFLGGALLRRFGQPPLVGYLIAGVVLGPSVLSLVNDTSLIALLAQMGVAFLMFSAGTELSLSQLRSMSGIALGGPWVQFLIMAPFVVLAVMWTRWPVTEMAYLGVIVALSSTTVVIKILGQRNEMDTQHGRAAIAFSMVQDFPMIPAMVIFGALSAASSQSGLAIGGSIAASFGKAVGFVVVAYAVGAKVLPAVLRKVSAQGGEMLLLAVVGIALGMAYLSNLIGISLILGAFIAGLVVAESEVNYRVLKQVAPISDLFVTFFFLSVGMLLDVKFVMAHLHQVILLVVVIMVAKAVVLSAVGMIFRQSGRTAILFGMSLGQIGEEAFLLAQVGLTMGIIGGDSYSLVLAGAVVSIILSPMLMRASSPVLRVLEAAPVLGRSFQDSWKKTRTAEVHLSGHAIICGYGQVGRELAQALQRRGVRYVVVERLPHLVAPLRQRGEPYVLGDATHSLTLSRAGVQNAVSLAVTFSHPSAVQAVVRAARNLRTGLPIVVRGAGDEGMVEDLQQVGATEVVHPSFEASMEFIRRVLRRSGVPSRVVDRAVTSRRIGFYG